MELLIIFGLAAAETLETSEVGKYRLPHYPQRRGQRSSVEKKFR